MDKQNKTTRNQDTMKEKNAVKREVQRDIGDAGKAGRAKAEARNEAARAKGE